MNQPIPTGPDLFGFAEAAYDKAKAAGQKPTKPTYGSAEETYQFHAAAHHGRQANTAALVMLAEVIANASGVDHDDLDAWREKIGMTWLKECRSKERRRPQCAERHTEDCAYADPPPEPKHELLPIGTRVLVASWSIDDDGYTKIYGHPVPGKIVGYAAGNTKYRWRSEYGPGHYATTDQWAIANNSVQVHPDGPECPPDPRQPKPPTGPRIYVKNPRGKQGYILDMRMRSPGSSDRREAQVQWFAPGVRPVWIDMSLLTIITEAEVHRCPNGQTGDECGSGENQCEPCLAVEDNEADTIERSMGLR